MKRMGGDILHVMKSRTTSALHVEIGNWKVNPSRRIEAMPITRHVQHALQEGLETLNAELGPHLRQELWQEGQKVGLQGSFNDMSTIWKWGVPMMRYGGCMGHRTSLHGSRSSVRRQRHSGGGQCHT